MIEREREKLAEERKRLEEDRLRRGQARNNSRINLKVVATAPSIKGTYTISIQTNVGTASLKINGEELGGREDGQYQINRVARAGQETKLESWLKTYTETPIPKLSPLVVPSLNQNPLLLHLIQLKSKSNPNEMR